MRIVGVRDPADRPPASNAGAAPQDSFQHSLTGLNQNANLFDDPNSLGTDTDGTVSYEDVLTVASWADDPAARERLAAQGYTPGQIDQILQTAAFFRDNPVYFWAIANQTGEEGKIDGTDLDTADVFLATTGQDPASLDTTQEALSTLLFYWDLLDTAARGGGGDGQVSRADLEAALQQALPADLRAAIEYMLATPAGDATRFENLSQHLNYGGETFQRGLFETLVALDNPVALNVVTDHQSLELTVEIEEDGDFLWADSGTPLTVAEVEAMYAARDGGRSPLSEVFRDTLFDLETFFGEYAGAEEGVPGWLHAVLDFVGMAPVVGGPADGINAGLYALEGDYLNAGISLFGLVPVAGEVAVGGRIVRGVGDDVVEEVAEGAVSRETRQEVGEGAARGAGHAAADGVDPLFEAARRAGYRGGADTFAQLLQAARKLYPEYADNPRFWELAADPAHAGNIFDKTMREAYVGLKLEEAGVLKAPITRWPNADAEFADAAGRPWDIKTFNSKYGYNRADAAGKIQRELARGENVILDTKDLSPGDLADLRQAVAEMIAQDPSLKDRILWFPG
ncbi:MAG: hypothetical protein AB2A00_35570 [Myxococcota bacterium]